jgi:hypothetical protein
MLAAGSVFWFAAFAVAYVLEGETLTTFYTFGGLSVPVLGYLLFKVLGMKAEYSQFTSLVAFSSALTAFCTPLLLFISNFAAERILPVLCAINAAHLLILCWVHLDYLYFLLAALGECLSIAFLFYVPAGCAHYVALVWGAVSLPCGILIHVLTKTPLRGYNVEIIDATL